MPPLRTRKFSLGAIELMRVGIRTQDVGAVLGVGASRVSQMLTGIAAPHPELRAAIARLANEAVADRVLAAIASETSRRQEATG